MSAPDEPPQMKKSLSRRMLLAGGGAAVVVVGAGGFAATRLLDADEFGFGGKSPDSEAAAYVKLLADVQDDYVNGRVVQHDGWILSQHEFDTIDSRARRPAQPATTVS
jgi:hypothetical protein